MADDVSQTTGRWEYKMIPQSHNEGENLAALNREGAKGWELVNIGRFSYTMKRRVCSLCRELQTP